MKKGVLEVCLCIVVGVLALSVPAAGQTKITRVPHAAGSTRATNGSVARPAQQMKDAAGRQHVRPTNSRITEAQRKAAAKRRQMNVAQAAQQQRHRRNPLSPRPGNAPTQGNQVPGGNGVQQ